jgi:predicted aminopeptidase
MTMSDLPESRTADKFIVRLPDGMRDQIAEAARANNRTMNAEVIARLQQTFAKPVVPEQERAELVALIEEALRLREQQRAGMAAKPAKKR